MIIRAIKKFLWKHRQRITITVVSAKEYYYYSDIAPGSHITVINNPDRPDPLVPEELCGPDRPPIRLEIEGKYRVEGIKVILNPWRIQKFIKFEDEP